MLPGVVACRVEAGDDGTVSADVVGAAGVDARSLALAARHQLGEKLGVTVPAEAMSVTVLQGREQEEASSVPQDAGLAAAADSAGARVRIDDVAVVARDLVAEARVSLSWHGQRWDGMCEGPNTSTRRLRLISEAALSGLERILGEQGLFSLEDIRVVDMLDDTVAIVILELTARRRGQRLTGSCSTAAAHGSIEEAVVRATLQSVNRLFGTFATGGQAPA